MFFRKVKMSISKVIGTVGGISGTVTFYSSNILYAKEIIDCHDCHMKRLPKSHELSFYEKDEDLNLEYDEQKELPLLSEISAVRQQVSGLCSYFSGFSDEMLHIYQTGIAHSKSSIDYIKSEENRIPRILTITSAGVAGYFFARKRGIFKKLLYTSLGSGLAFSAFYPSIAKEYASTGWKHTKKSTSNILEKYGGYDTQKLAEQTQEKVELVKSTLKLEGVTSQLKEWFEKNKEKVSNTLNIISEDKVVKENISESSTKSKVE